MRLGSISLWGDDLDAFRRQVRRSEDAGHDVIGVGDTPSAWQDIVVALTIAAQETSRARLATMVTTPFLRHPLVLARALSSLSELSGGRVVLGIGAGGSAVASIGRGPARIDHLRAYVLAVRGLLAGESVEWDGFRTAPLVNPRPVPIYLAADGPRSLELAGEVADGVVVTGCRSLDVIDQRLDTLRTAAKDAGRDAADIDVWAMSYVSIRETRAEAIDDITPYLAVMGGLWLRKPYARALVPPELIGRVEEMERRYDPTEHVVVGAPQARLVRELGLADFLADLTAMAGTPDEVRETVGALEERGVSTLVASLAGHADPDGTLRRVGEMVGT
jgi:5,10-methylenetetrahydromethanopterin reductase